MTDEEKSVHEEKKSTDTRSDFRTDSTSLDNVTKDDSEDMTAFVQNLLEQMHERLQNMSQNIIGKLDEMGSRLDEVEKSLEDVSVSPDDANESGSKDLSPDDE